MGVPAPARTTPVLPARRPARTAPRRQPGTRNPASGHKAGLRLVGRSAQAVTHIPESGLVKSAATGRRWIVLIGALLLLIVAINVVTVSYGSMASKLETKIQSIERQNTILKSTETAALAMPEVQKRAATEGMLLPQSDEIIYRSFKPSDFAAAAERLAVGGG